MRLDLAYACAQGYTRTQVASDAETAAVASRNVKARARERLEGSQSAVAADSEGSVFRLVSAL